MSIDATGQFTLADVWRGTLMMSKAYLIWFSVIALACFGLSALMLFWPDEDRSVWSLFFTLGIIFSILPWSKVFYRSYRSWKGSPIFRGSLRWHFDDAGYAIEGLNVKAERGWAGIIKWKEGKHLFLLMPQPKLGEMIPKHFFANSADVSAFRELLRTNVAAKK